MRSVEVKKLVISVNPSVKKDLRVPTEAELLREPPDAEELIGDYMEEKS